MARPSSTRPLCVAPPGLLPSRALSTRPQLGDAISLSGKIAAYRSDPSYLYSTELTSPSALVVLPHNNTVAPLVLGGAGADRSPPTQSLSPLDAAAGPDGWLALPNNQSLVSAANGTLQPGAHGLDFWKSVEGMLVTVRAPVALGFPNSYGEFWVRGDWPATGVNGRGGLSITFGRCSGGAARSDAESECAQARTACPTRTLKPFSSAARSIRARNRPRSSGRRSRTSRVSCSTSPPRLPRASFTADAARRRFGYYYLLPLTAPTVLSTPAYDPPAAPFNSSATAGDPCALTLGDYNVENMGPRVAHLPVVAGHIVSALHTPDLLFLQEIQDNSGEGDDGTVAANVTLGKLVAAIAAAGGAFNYSWAEIDPVDGQDGGVPGGNIRPVYLCAGLLSPARITHAAQVQPREADARPGHARRCARRDGGHDRQHGRARADVQPGPDRPRERGVEQLAQAARRALADRERRALFHRRRPLCEQERELARAGRRAPAREWRRRGARGAGGRRRCALPAMPSCPTADPPRRTSSRRSSRSTRTRPSCSRAT
jgi:hypothetical protein